ncbi:ultraviolet-B receptor UVR8 [Tanacetum coccineum]
MAPLPGRIVRFLRAEKIPEKAEGWEKGLTGLSTAKYLAMQVTCRTLPKILHGYDVEDSMRQETSQHLTQLLLFVESGMSMYSVGCGLGWKIGHGTKNYKKQPRLIEQFQTLNLQQMVVAAAAWHAAMVERDGRYLMMVMSILLGVENHQVSDIIPRTLMLNFTLENIGGHGAAIEEIRSTNSDVKFYMFKI